MPEEPVVIDAEHTDVTGTELALRPEMALAPLVSPEEAKLRMREYQELCEAILEPSDYQEFTQSVRVNGEWVKKVHRFKKKSAVKKLQTFFGVEIEVMREERDDLGDGHFAFRVVARARTRSGRFVDATGACSTLEERFDLEKRGNESESQFEARQKKALARAYHDVLSTAETRASNRAVMNCIGVGGGEVTAEEAQSNRREQQRQAPRQQQPQQDTEEQRKRGLRAVHALKDELHLDDDTYRGIIKERFPSHFEDPEVQVSASWLDVKELSQLYRYLDAIRKEQPE